MSLPPVSRAWTAGTYRCIRPRTIQTGTRDREVSCDVGKSPSMLPAVLNLASVFLQTADIEAAKGRVAGCFKCEPLVRALNAFRNGDVKYRTKKARDTSRIIRRLRCPLVYRVRAGRYGSEVVHAKRGTCARSGSLFLIASVSSRFLRNFVDRLGSHEASGRLFDDDALSSLRILCLNAPCTI